MNMTPADGRILKIDVLGRVKTPRERREQLLDEFEKSGLTGQKFAALVGIKYQTFATWAQKRRRARGTYPLVKRPKRLRWVEAVVQEGGGDEKPLVLELPGGARMEIKDAGQATLAGALLRTLAKPC
jgi:hypothetical protein